MSDTPRVATKAATRIVRPLPGLVSYTTPRGIRVTEIRYWANPSHDDAWANGARPLYATHRDWRREMELDWTSPSGDPFFPEFVEVGRPHFEHTVTRLIAGPVYRSFDFGRRRPACTWFQYSAKSDRVWFYREFMPHDLGTHDFRDAVRHFSNELEYEKLSDRAKRWVDSYASRPSNAHCPPPWFPLGTRYINLAGKEALQQQSNAAEPEDAVAKDIFAAGGIDLVIVNPRVEGRHRIMRRLMSLRPDGFPGIWLDPQCEELILCLDGGCSYATAGRDGVIKEAMKDDGHLINLADAAGYGVAAVVPVDSPDKPKAKRLLGFGGASGREEIYEGDSDEQIGWKS